VSIRLCWTCKQPATHTLTRDGSIPLDACDNCTRIDLAEAEARGWTVAPIHGPGVNKPQLSTIELAVIVVAGTALVAAPIDPRPLRASCQRHPNASLLLTECPSCAQELYDIEQANRARAEAELSTRVRKALGLRGYPHADGNGETARRVAMWSQEELNAVYERVGGTVTARTVKRTGSCSTWGATEITVTVDLPGIGTVEAFTDWDEETGGRDLPLMQAIPDAELIAT
jgi:hypothetical protein